MHKTTPISLKKNFLWTFSGNMIFAACQWSLLSVIAKLTDPAVLGKYALAVGIVAPLIIIANFNVGVMLVTDTERRYRFQAYRTARLALTGFAFVLLLIICAASHLSREVTTICLIVGLIQAVDCFSELYYSLTQRRERMSSIAVSLMIRGVLSLSGAGLALYLTRNLICALCAMAACRLTVFFIYDLSMRQPADASDSEEGSRSSDLEAAYRIAKTALPLALVSFLSALSINTPRYFIEKYCGHRDLGIFAAMWSLITAGNMIAIAIGQALFPRLAKLYTARHSRAFRGLTLRAVGIGLGLGAAGTLIAMLLGKRVLGLLYRPEYAEAHWLLTGMMCSASVLYAVTLLGYAATAAKSFINQAALMTGVVMAVIAANAYFVPRFGLWGAVISVAIGNTVYIVGMVIIVTGLIQNIGMPESHAPIAAAVGSNSLMES